jgi:WS/DGAT/MGAT family acyltransferase
MATPRHGSKRIRAVKANTSEAVGTRPGAWFERLTALDAAFLDLEGPTAPMHVGSVSIFEGKAPQQKELARLIASRLERVPRYGQRLALVPFRVGRPVWVDDPGFDLSRHLRRLKLPRPGNRQQLLDLVGGLFARHLDRERPLWEIWVVEGLVRGRFAVVTKTHHCMVDGVSGVDLASVLLDVDEKTGPPPVPSSRKPRPAPGPVEMVTEALGEVVRRPFDLAREASSPAAEGRGALKEILGGLRPLLGIGALGPAPSSSLNQTVSAGRRWEMLAIDLAEVKRVRSALGGTVNDVVLAVMAGALRTLLLGRNEKVIGDLRVLVPVSVRSPEAQGTLGNQVAAFFCRLPVNEPEPANRLRKVSRAMGVLKERRQAVGAMALTRLAEFAPPTLAAFSARLQSIAPWFNIVVTNVPGPQMPLYLLGRKLLACHPAVPLTEVTTISIALLSYDGAIDIGLLGDDEHAADLPALARAIPEALAELSKLAAGSARSGA